jgi:hypothetical protein
MVNVEESSDEVLAKTELIEDEKVIKIKQKGENEDSLAVVKGIFSDWLRGNSWGMFEGWNDCGGKSVE